MDKIFFIFSKFIYKNNTFDVEINFCLQYEHRKIGQQEVKNKFENKAERESEFVPS